MLLKFQKSPYSYLLADSTVRQWLENAERGSPTVATSYLKQMGRICKDFKVTPQELASMDEKKATEFLTELASKYEAQGLRGATINNYIKALKNWWSFTSGIQIKRKIKLDMDYNKYENEKVPSREELQRIFEHSDMRAKVCVALMSFCGFRDGVLGNFLGSDGLKVGDFVEMKISGKNVEFEKVPTMIKVRRSLSKTSNPYFVFLPKQGCDYVKEYLEFRMRKGEKIDENSAVVSSNRKRKMGSHLRTPKVASIIRKTLRKAGFNWRPYVLRRYFDVRMMEAEADGLVLYDWRQFFMGHKGSIEATYTVNKALPTETVEKMREAYRKASEKYLVTAGKEEVRDIRTELAKQLLLISGYKEEEIEKLDISKMTNEEIQQKIRERLLGGTVNHVNRQKVIHLSEIEDYITRGWEYVTTLPNERAILRLPS